MQTIIVYMYLTAVGFVLAGVLSSFVQLVSGQPMRFVTEPAPILQALGSVVLRVFAGPAILMRNAWAALRIETRPNGWFWCSAAIAGVWSLFIGTLFVDLALKL